MVAVLGLVAVYSADMAIGRDTARNPQQRVQAEMKEKIARAGEAYKAARSRCAPLKGAAEKACVRKAEATRDAAVRQARIEKVRHLAALREEAEDRRKGKVKQLSPKERYAAARARCEMMGPERDRCMGEAKERFHKS